MGMGSNQLPFLENLQGRRERARPKPPHIDPQTFEHSAAKDVIIFQLGGVINVIAPQQVEFSLPALGVEQPEFSDSALLVFTIFVPAINRSVARADDFDNQVGWALKMVLLQS